MNLYIDSLKTNHSTLLGVVNKPGMVLNDGFSIACGTKAVKIIEAQRPGKSAQKSDVFLLGFKLQPGMKLD